MFKMKARILHWQHTIRMSPVEGEANFNIIRIAGFETANFTTEQSRKGLRASLFPQKPATLLLKAQSLANW